MKAILVALGTLVALSSAQRDYTTPVPILKQINKHNEDGSYSYGYEAADQSFKIETKYPNGEVYGKYGYVDDTGKVREVEYGASQRGFEPQGNDINVPPPTLVNDNKNAIPLGPNEVDDGQYREDPSVYYKNEGYNSKPVAASNFRLNNAPQYNAPQPQYNAPQPQYNAPQPKYNPPQPQYNPPQPKYNPHQQHFQPQPQYNSKPQYQQQQYNSQPAQNQWNQQLQSNNGWNNHHHPALSNIDIQSGSYSVSYTGR